MNVNYNGSGIATEVMEHLFEPYFMTKKEGTRIGLYLIYRIIYERIGGVVRFENKGEGVCVKIEIPYTNIAKSIKT